MSPRPVPQIQQTRPPQPATEIRRMPFTLKQELIEDQRAQTASPNPRAKKASPMPASHGSVLTP